MLRVSSWVLKGFAGFWIAVLLFSQYVEFPQVSSVPDLNWCYAFCSPLYTHKFSIKSYAMSQWLFLFITIHSSHWNLVTVKSINLILYRPINFLLSFWFLFQHSLSIRLFQFVFALPSFTAIVSYKSDTFVITQYLLRTRFNCVAHQSLIAIVHY